MKKTTALMVGLVAAATSMLSSCDNKNGGNASSTPVDSAKVAPTEVAALPPAPAGELPTVGLRIAWVNMDSLLHAYDYYDEMEREMASLSASAEKELTSKGKALEQRMAEFQDKVQKGLMTRSEAQQQQEELGAEQQRFLQLQESKRQQLLEEEQVRLRKVQSAIIDFIGRYNQQKGFNYILSTGTLYADPRLSVTAEVLQGLNAEYAAKRQTSGK